jgi:hypothetical protein
MDNDAPGLKMQLAAIKEDASNLVAGLTDAAFNWKPDAAHWSIAQCLDHLNVTGYLYLPQLTAKIGQSAPSASAQNYRLRWFGKLFVRQLEPPVKTKFKAPKSFVPAPEKLLDEVVPEFMRLQDVLAQEISAADQVNWARVKVVSPASKLIRINLTEAFAVITAHERRHLYQAWQVRKNPDFPS